MKVVDLEEAKANLDQYARECQSSPVVVTVDGLPTFELIPIRSDDPEFLDRLIERNPAFRNLMVERRRESDQGRVSSLESVRARLDSPSE
jgi:antitoxin (DNA-binding transcriptional repressor) of toxin-antitoxin stability system